MSQGKIFVLSAPSGAGKSTLKDALTRRFPQLQYSVSATTRKPRPGEEEGVHYFFKSMDEFRQMIDAGELVEFMEVHGNYYGTPNGYLQELSQKGIHAILDLDVYGKVNFDKTYPDAVGILIVPPNMDELRSRLLSRAQDSEETIKLRLENASRELDFAHEKGRYEYTVINDNLSDALEKLTEIFAKEMGLKPVM